MYVAGEGIHTSILAYIHAYMHTCIHTYIHTHMHTYIVGGDNDPLDVCEIGLRQIETGKVRPVKVLDM
jgi:inorganic pyrophosphatase